MPIEELMKIYSAAENESTDLQSDEESSQESSEEGIAGLIALSRFVIISGVSDSLVYLFVCLFVELSDEEGMEYLVQQEKDRASESQVCLFIKVLCI